MEFLNLMHKLQSGPNERELKNEMFLVRGKSLITPGLPGQLLLRRRPPPAFPLQALDDNMDGFVDIDELRAAFARMAAADASAEVPSDEMLAQMISEVALRDGKKFDSSNFQALLSVLKLPKMA